MKFAENGINCIFLSVGLLESTNQTDWGAVTCNMYTGSKKSTQNFN
jgi:hypothetical protein